MQVRWNTDAKQVLGIMPTTTDKKTDELKLVYASKDGDDDEDVDTKFNMLDIFRMLAGLIILWCVVNKVLTGHYVNIPWQAHLQSTSRSPPKIPSYWSARELPLPFTLDQLSHYTGTTETSRILLSVKGHVFDVTEGKSFYGKLGPYRKFAGTDCSNLLSYSMWDMSALGKKCNQDLTMLTSKGIARVDSWLAYFAKKYPEIGYLVEK